MDYCYNVRCWLTQLAVQKGDTLTVTAPGYYPHPVQVSSFAFSLAAFVAGLLQQQQPAMPGGPDENGRTRPLPLLSISIRGSRPVVTRTPKTNQKKDEIKALGTR